ncbi:MAG TPA: carboxypeptidase regulatory-like domain-containing protein [Longimicrobiales bacterium]|nr:carboxypeptidase regulatory-like domain-containing protein [Longimicrobiales bacterium]
MLAKRISGIVLVGLVPLLVACGGDAGDGSEGGADGGAQQAPVDLSNAGSVSGTVTFTGTAPAPQPIDMSDEEQCAAAHEEQPVRHVVLTGADGGLANVFVYVKEGLPAGEWPTPDQAVTLDQEGCEYHPHVFGLQTGQDLEIKNSDGLLHNINTTPDENRGFNISQPTTMTSTRTFTTPEIMIPVRCDVHGWMEAYIGVTDHPYFAVSGEDGTFSIDNLPPGDYVLEAWHEHLGTQTANVTVAPNGDATAEFSFDAGMAGRHVPLGEPLVVRHLGHGHEGGDAI